MEIGHRTDAVLIGSRMHPLRSQITVIHKDEYAQSTVSIRTGSLQVTNAYFPPSMITDQWTSALLAIPDAPQNQPCDGVGTIHVLMGDWNTRLGKVTGDTRTNGRAPQFTEVIQSRGLSVIPLAASTPTLFDSRSRASIIDFAMVSSDHLTMCSAVSVLDQDQGGSDHFPIMVVVSRGNDHRSQPQTSTLPLNPRRIASHLLERSVKIRQAYTEEVDASLRVLLTRCRQSWIAMRTDCTNAREDVLQGLLDDLTDTLLMTLTSVAGKHCKAHKTPPTPRPTKSLATVSSRT